MNEINWCLEAITKLLNDVEDVDRAYLLRSRLYRVILRVARIASKTAGLQPPQRPEIAAVSRTMPESAIALIEGCNSLVAEAKTILQPSEPLDPRWREGWQLVVNNLREIDRNLRGLSRSLPQYPDGSVDKDAHLRPREGSH